LSLDTTICIGLYLFGEKYANPEEYAAFWVMLSFIIIFAIVDISFGFYHAIACKLRNEWVTPIPKEVEMKQVGGSDVDPLQTKQDPSPVS